MTTGRDRQRKRAILGLLQTETDTERHHFWGDYRQTDRDRFCSDYSQRQAQRERERALLG